jgi:hypothetical protein
MKVSDIRHVPLDPSSPSSLSPNLTQTKISEELLLSKLSQPSQTCQLNKTNDVLRVTYAYRPYGVSVLLAEVRNLIIHQGMDRVGIGRILDFFALSRLTPPPAAAATTTTTTTTTTTATVTSPSSVSFSQPRTGSSPSLMHLHVVCDNLSFQFTASINSILTAAVLVVPRLHVIHQTPFSSRRVYDQLDLPSNRYRLIANQCELGILHDLATSNLPVSSTSLLTTSVSSYWSERGFVSIAHLDILELDLTLSTNPPLVDICVAGDIILDTCADSLHMFYTLLSLWLSGIPPTKNPTSTTKENYKSVNNTIIDTNTNTNNNNKNNSNCEPNNSENSADVETGLSGNDDEGYVVLRLLSKHQDTSSSRPTITASLSGSELSDQPYRIRWHVRPQGITIREDHFSGEDSFPLSEVFTLPSKLPPPHVQFSLQNVTFLWKMRPGGDRKSSSSNSSGRGPVLMSVTLHKLCLLWAQFKESTVSNSHSRRPVWRLQLSIGDIIVHDYLPTSSWNKFLCYNSKIPRQKDRKMLTLLLQFDEPISSTSLSLASSRIGTCKVVITTLTVPLYHIFVSLSLSLFVYFSIQSKSS